MWYYKGDAIIELFDDGIGMNDSGIATYVKVGFNKRIDSYKPTDDNYLTMGRKGIGKLAAFKKIRLFPPTETADQFLKTYLW